MRQGKGKVYSGKMVFHIENMRIKRVRVNFMLWCFTLCKDVNDKWKERKMLLVYDVFSQKTAHTCTINNTFPHFLSKHRKMYFSLYSIFQKEQKKIHMADEGEKTVNFPIDNFIFPGFI